MATVEKVDWFCPKCNSYVSSESVTFEETHQICNTRVILEHLNQNKMKITKRELGLKFKLGKNGSEIDKILHHIYHLQGLISYNLRRGKKVHYCRKQIEVAKRKLKPFKSQLHPIELRTINL